MPAAQRNLALDIEKLVMALAVVGIHAELLKDIWPVTGRFLVDYLFRAAVSVFFIINGYYFARIASDAAAVRRWVIKLLVLYGFWTLCYLPDIIARAAQSRLPVATAAVSLLFGHLQLWYVPALIMGGIGVALTAKMRPRTLLILAGGLFATGVALQYLAALQLLPRILTETRTDLYVYRNGLFYGFPMVLAGSLAYRARERITTSVAVLCIGVGLVLMLAEFLCGQALGFSGHFDMGLFLAPLALGLFLAVIRQPSREVPGALADLPSAIFFSHMIFMTQVFGGVTPSPLRWLVVVLASVALAYPLIRANRWLIGRTGYTVL